jgi:hypothetical protein
MFLFERNMTFSENETLFFVLTWGKVEQLIRPAQSANPLFLKCWGFCLFVHDVGQFIYQAKTVPNTTERQNKLIQDHTTSILYALRWIVFLVPLTLPLRILLSVSDIKICDFNLFLKCSYIFTCILTVKSCKELYNLLLN